MNEEPQKEEEEEEKKEEEEEEEEEREDEKVEEEKKEEQKDKKEKEEKEEGVPATEAITRHGHQSGNRRTAKRNPARATQTHTHTHTRIHEMNALSLMNHPTPITLPLVITILTTTPLTFSSSHPTSPRTATAHVPDDGLHQGGAVSIGRLIRSNVGGAAQHGRHQRYPHRRIPATHTHTPTMYVKASSR
jgi:hypothetical protein